MICLLLPRGGCKQSNIIRKARALGAAHGRKKRRPKGPVERRGKGGGTQSQLPVVERSRGRQAQPPTIVVVEEVTTGVRGLGRVSEDNGKEL